MALKILILVGSGEKSSGVIRRVIQINCQDRRHLLLSHNKEQRMICIGERVKRTIDEMNRGEFLFALEQVSIAIAITAKKNTTKHHQAAQIITKKY
jgi:hypothetical protein